MARSEALAMKIPTLRLCAALVLAAGAAGCGGGSSTSAAVSSPAAELAQPQPSPQPQVPQAQFTNLLVIGNSITRIPPSPALGWTGNWGMAASSPDNDFAHLTAATLNLPLTALNFSELEKAPMANTWQIPSYAQTANAQTAAVVELGDNVSLSSVSEFGAAYGTLLDALHVAKLACVSTWWREDAKDAVIENACKAHGGKYVFIGDIYPQRADDVGRYADRDVDAHPHDWSMQVIATRVVAALRG